MGQWWSIIGFGSFLLGGYVWTLPDEWKVERSISMRVGPDELMDRLLDFRGQGTWSPWEKKDPNIVKTYYGEPGQVGWGYTWKGNNQVGEGHATLRMVSARRVVLDVTFIQPMQDTCQMSFEIATPTVGISQLSWALYGKHNFFSKFICGILLSMDAHMGKDLAEGLRNLKQLVEKDTAEGDGEERGEGHGTTKQEL